MEAAILESLATGGPVAILALVIFIMYVKDRRHAQEELKTSYECLREDRKFMEDRLTGILESDRESREASTKAMTELTAYLKGLNNRNRDLSNV